LKFCLPKTEKNQIVVGLNFRKIIILTQGKIKLVHKAHTTAKHSSLNFVKVLKFHIFLFLNYQQLNKSWNILEKILNTLFYLVFFNNNLKYKFWSVIRW